MMLVGSPGVYFLGLKGRRLDRPSFRPGLLRRCCTPTLPSSAAAGLLLSVGREPARQKASRRKELESMLQVERRSVPRTRRRRSSS